MFERLEVLSGDIELGSWLVDKTCISYAAGISVAKRIPYSAIKDITRKEQIKNDVYIEFKFVNGDVANAKLHVNHYSKLYELYMTSRDNAKPLNSPLSPDDKANKMGYDWSQSSSTKNQSKSNKHLQNFGLSVFALLIFYSCSHDSSNRNSTSILALPSHQKETICKQYIGSLMGRDKNIMYKYQEADNDTVYVRYNLDNEYWSYACTFTDNSIVWTAWLMRDTPPAWGRTRFEDEAALTYNQENKTVTIAGHGTVSL